MLLKVCVPLLLVASAALSGCAAAPTPAPTVTVTVAPPVPTVLPGDGAAWDLSAICAAQAEIETLITWREQQAEADRLTSPQSDAVLQAIAVQNLRLGTSGRPDPVADDVATLVAAAGTLEEPDIDLGAREVVRARRHIAGVCQENGLTIGVLAQGG